jgi:hypothetical protein
MGITVLLVIIVKLNVHHVMDLNLINVLFVNKDIFLVIKSI